MHSHHSHSGSYCTHATGELDDCIKEAIAQKFELFCLTEHIPRWRESDLYPGETQTLTDLMTMFQSFHARARQLQRKYTGQIQILVGLETEYIRPIDLEILRLLINAYPVDMVVGSVHHVNSIPIDFDTATWRQALATCRDEEDFYGTYLDHQFAIIDALEPLVIGHFDVVLLWAPADTDLFAWQSVADKIRRNIKRVVAYGGMFELNSAAFRKGWTTAYPRRNVVDCVQSLGGRFCLSDDSHGPHHVGLNFHRLQEYVQSVGITELASLKGQSSSELDGRCRVAVQHDEDTLARFMAWKARVSDTR